MINRKQGVQLLEKERQYVINYFKGNDYYYKKLKQVYDDYKNKNVKDPFFEYIKELFEVDDPLPF